MVWKNFKMFREGRLTSNNFRLPDLIMGWNEMFSINAVIHFVEIEGAQEWAF